MALSSHRSTWAAMLALTSATACGESDPAGSGGTAQGGAGPSGPVTSTVGNGPATTTTTAQSAQSSSGVGGSSYVCDPPAEPGSLYENFAESFDFNVLEPVSMCEFRDQVLLIVNTAAL
ncbi:MAG: hypothetical protein HOV80_18885 [Polyangiaceae bacterium]|nr:hypothetical protein [Polyangiaceae bacterium]